MAVELRCPECRAKLRLQEAPETGAEVECPKCGTVFLAPEAKTDADEDTPKKKKKKEDQEEKPEKGEDKKEKKPKDKKGAKDGDQKGPKKRKFKKKETSKAALIAVIAAGVLMLGFASGVLIWFFSRTSKAVEMMYYVPDDAQFATGINIGHVQKYPDFYKSIKSSIEGSDYKRAGDAIAKADGTEFEELVDYVVKGYSIDKGWSIVYRTKYEFDGGSLSKLPSAERKTLDGNTYYLVPTLLPSNQPGRVFSPTNRLIVVCPDAINDNAYKKILNGHADDKESTLGIRMGPLGKRVTRGTFWQMGVFDKQLKAPTAPVIKPGSNVNDDDAFMAVVADSLSGGQGFGVKASLGSREVRFEMIAWCSDSDKAQSFYTKMKEGDLGKGDEGTPPRWFSNKTQGLGDKKVAAQILSNIGFGVSGELFYAKSAVETKDLMQSAGSSIGKVMGGERRSDATGPGGAAPTPRRRRWVRR